MEKEAALANLLAELFPTAQTLKRVVYSLPTQAASIPQAIDFSGPARLIAISFVDELRRRGLINERFFNYLVEERPQHSDQIRALQQKWLLENSEWTRPPNLEAGLALETEAPTVFVSYARTDTAFFEELSTHLSVLQRKGLIKFWHEGRIRGGEAWEDIIKDQFQNADIIILLVSAGLLASDFFWDLEFSAVLKRQRHGKATVIPVIVGPCLWQQSPLAEFQVLPADGKPVSLSPNPDRAWVAIVRQLEKVAKQTRSAK